MRRPTRRETGGTVTRLVGALSDQLLGDETRCQHEMEDQFVAALPAGRRLTGGPQETLGRQADVAAVALGAAARCLAPAEALWLAAADKALGSLRKELEAVEANLGRRYDGLAREATDQALEHRAPMVTQAVQDWAYDVAATMVWWDTQLDAELRAGVLAEEDAEMVARRLFSADPVYAPGHSGGGLWWKAYQSAFMAARSQEFLVVNGIREAGMLAFNRAGVAVRDG